MFALVRRSIAIGCALAALSSSLRAGVVVVQGGSLQAAINAAAEGDVLLVSGGPYDELQYTITAKSLTILGDPAGSVTIAPLTITNLSASQQCTIAGLVVRAQSSPYAGAVVVTNCSGSVRLEALRLEFQFGIATPALTVGNSTDVAAVRCELYGSDAAASSSCCGGHPGGAGVLCAQSKLALYDCYLRGGPGEYSFMTIGGNQTPAGAGGPGIRVQPGSTVFASACLFEGGPGADGVTACFPIPCTMSIAVPPAAGGSVIQFEGPSSNVWLADSALVGGPGGSGGIPGSCCSLPDAPAGSSSPGLANVLPAAHLALVAPTHVRELTSLQLNIEGVPGDLVGLFVADGSAWQLDLASAGVLLQAPITRRLVFGTIPPSGTFPVSLPISALPPGIDAQRLRLQAVSRAPSGAVRLGSPAVLTILDQAF